MVTAAKPAVGGAVFYGALSATLPTAAGTSLGADFTGVGYISDAGVVRSQEMDTDVIKAWGGDVVLVLDNGKTETFNFRMLEATDAAVLKLLNGEDNVTGALATGITVKSNNVEKVGHAFVIDMIEKGNTLHRIVIPNGVITEIGDTTYVDNDAIGGEITITAIADSSGNTAYEYLKTAASSGT